MPPVRGGLSPPLPAASRLERDPPRGGSLPPPLGGSPLKYLSTRKRGRFPPLKWPRWRAWRPLRDAHGTSPGGWRPYRARPSLARTCFRARVGGLAVRLASPCARSYTRTVLLTSIPAGPAVFAAGDLPLGALPFVQGSVAAGFPSPADDFHVKRLDLNSLIRHPLSTFFWRVSGHSMADAGIADGDLLMVDRALPWAHRHIVVAQVDGEFTVKYVHKRADRVKLVPANPTYPEITLKEGQQLVICGVVILAIKQFVK